MPSARWDRIQQLFDEALRLQPQDRDPFLTEACGDDETLRSEVRSILAAHDRAGSFMAVPAPELARDPSYDPPERPTTATYRFVAGSRLGPYEVVCPLGRGGMGEVYRARDARLGRDVALKVLRPEISEDRERVRRFEQEARAASALSHPAILAIYDIGRVDDTLYIVMELIDGQTLRQMLASESLPPQRLFTLAAQLARGLAKAHAAGIIHRDLKPENIMVTSDGFAKILDFGLAKLQLPASGRGDALSEPWSSTRSGLVMGTLGYMSPEQAHGDPLDFRSDQFSFGVVLYEMAAHRRPFDGRSMAEYVAELLTRKPAPLARRNPFALAAFQRILDRCLAVAPEMRFESTATLATELELLVGSAARATGASRGDLITKRRVLAGWAGAAVLLTVLVLRREAAYTPPPAAVPTVLVRGHEPMRLTHHAGSDTGAHWSPDGTRLVFSTNRDGASEVYVMKADGSGLVNVTNHPASDGDAAWSPDGRRIVFISDRQGGGVFAINADGSGEAERIGPLGSMPGWSPDGRRILFHLWTGANPDVHVIDVASRRLQRLTRHPAFDGHASWAPDGNQIAFQTHRDGNFEIYLMDAEGGNLRRLTTHDANDTSPAWSPDGERIAFNSERDGNVELYVMNADGTNQERVTHVPEHDSGASWSPDGERIAFTTFRDGNAEIYTMKAPASNVRRLTHDPADDDAPSWSPDGERIAFTSNRDGKREIYVMDLQGAVRRLTRNQVDDHYPRWSPDGSRIAFIVQSGDVAEIHAMNPDGSGAYRLATDAAGQPVSWSPEGKRIAFTRNRDGKLRVYLMDLEQGGAAEMPLTMACGDEPVWSPDSIHLLVRGSTCDGPGELYVVRADGSDVRRLTRHPSYKGAGAWSPDGKRIAFMSEQDGPPTPGSRELYVMNADGSGLRRLTHNRGVIDSRPSWSPDGRSIAFHSTRHGSFDIYVMSVQ